MCVCVFQNEHIFQKIRAHIWWSILWYYLTLRAARQKSISGTGMLMCCSSLDRIVHEPIFISLREKTSWGMFHSYVTWLTHAWHDSLMRDMTHSYVTWLIHTWHDSFIHDITHSYHSARIRRYVTAKSCDMTHVYVTWLIHTWHDSFIFDMTHSYVTCLIHMWHGSSIRDMTYSHVTRLIHKIVHRPVFTSLRNHVTWLIHM